MKRAEVRLVLGAVLAVVVPASMLHLSADDTRRAAGLTMAPFGWPRLLVAHLLTALPLGFWFAGQLHRLSAVTQWSRGLWVLLAVAGAGAATQLVPPLGSSIGETRGQFAALLMRSGIALVLVLPWCLAAAEAMERSTASLSRYGLLVFGLICLLLPPWLYTGALIESRTKQASELLERERLARAELLLTGLCELGSQRPVLKKAPAEIRQTLNTGLARLRKAAQRALPAGAPAPVRLEWANLLIQVDRLDDARATLRPLVPSDPTATLILAGIHRDEEQWDESNKLFTLMWKRLADRMANDPESADLARVALEGLIFNAQAERRPAEVERLLLLGRERFPADAGQFALQLGQHYANGGRPAAALQQYNQAEQLKPSLSERIRPLRDQLYQSTPGCLLRWSGSSSIPSEERR